MSRLAAKLDARLAILVLFLGAAHCWSEHHVASPLTAVSTSTANDSMPLSPPSAPVCENSGCLCHGATLAVTVDVPVDASWTFLTPTEPDGLSRWLALTSDCPENVWDPPVVLLSAPEVCAQLQTFLL